MIENQQVNKENNNDNARKKWHIVIEYENKKGIPFDIDNIIDYLKESGQLSFILHHLDVDINGVRDRKHYHCVCNFHTKIRFNTLLNKLVKLGYPSEIFGIQPITNYTSMLRYLVHLDDPQKTQYTPMEVSTNCENVFLTALKFNSDNVNANKLLHVVLISKGNRFLIMRDLGLENYIKYRNPINDLINLYFNGYFNDDEVTTVLKNEMKGGL